MSFVPQILFYALRTVSRSLSCSACVSIYLYLLLLCYNFIIYFYSIAFMVFFFSSVMFFVDCWYIFIFRFCVSSCAIYFLLYVISTFIFIVCSAIIFPTRNMVCLPNKSYRTTAIVIIIIVNNNINSNITTTTTTKTAAHQLRMEIRLLPFFILLLLCSVVVLPGNSTPTVFDFCNIEFIPLFRSVLFINYCWFFSVYRLVFIFVCLFLFIFKVTNFQKKCWACVCVCIQTCISIENVKLQAKWILMWIEIEIYFLYCMNGMKWKNTHPHTHKNHPHEDGKCTIFRI